MKKIFFTLVLLIPFNYSFPQYEIKGGMGINFISIPSVQDYINQNFAPSDAQLPAFNSAVIFALEGGIFMNQNFELGIEIPYQIYSYNENVFLGQYDLEYNSFLPSVLAYYVFPGKGYYFKFGGGVGPRLNSITESMKWNGSEKSLSSIGLGFVIRAEGNTVLSENVYANIGIDIRYDINGEPEDKNGALLKNSVNNKNVNFDSFSLGLRLGISYLIGVNY